MPVPSLAQRRQYLKLITHFKILKRSSNYMHDASVHARSLPRILRNSSLLLTRPTANSNSYDSSFFPSSIAIYMWTFKRVILFSFTKTCLISNLRYYSFLLLIFWYPCYTDYFLNVIVTSKNKNTKGADASVQ